MALGAAAGAAGMNPWVGGAMAAGALAPTLFGSGGKVSVPGSMARPTDPTTKFVDESGMLRDQFKTAGLSNQMLDQGQGILGGLQHRAEQVGPSQSAQYLQGASDLQTQAMKDQMGRDSSSQLASQQANMAMKGGLGSGSAERMAGSMADNNVMRSQQLNQQNSLNKMNTLAQDEQQKLGILKNLPGQMQSFGNEQMGRQVGDVQGGMNLLQNKYGTDMQAYGAKQMAVAQANAQNASSKGLLSGLF